MIKRIPRVSAKFLLLLPIALLTVYSCGEILNTDDYEIEKLKATPTISLPLASGDLVVQDILSQADVANIKVDQNQVVYLLYEQTLKTQGINDLLTFQNRTFNKTVPIPPGTLSPKTAEVQYATLNTTEDFNFSPERLSEIKFKNTTLRITVTFSPANPASGLFEVRVRLPNIKLNNVAFDRRVTAGALGTTFSLRDYVATLSNNTFPLELTFYERPHTNSATITNLTTATVRVEFGTIDFQYVRGFFGDQTAFNIPPETINFDAFGTALSKANVSFADPKLSFTVSNDYGIPTKVTFNPLEARKTGGAKLPVILNPASPITINVPTTLGQSAITNVNVTNAKPLIDFVPDQLYYQISARINEGLTNGNNFCADTSKIRVGVKAEIPLYGRASGMVLADTFAVDFSDVDDTNIESGSILAKINNQLPLDAFIQLYLANDQAVIFDSLFTTAQTAIVKASTVNVQGELQTAGVSDLQIELVKAKLDKLFDARKIIVKARMNTSKNASGNLVDVKFKSTYKMSVIFGLKAKLKLEVDL